MGATLPRWSGLSVLVISRAMLAGVFNTPGRVTHARRQVFGEERDEMHPGQIELVSLGRQSV